jgi:hypothetical protein
MHLQPQQSSAFVQPPPPLLQVPLGLHKPPSPGWMQVPPMQLPEHSHPGATGSQSLNPLLHAYWQAPLHATTCSFGGGEALQLVQSGPQWDGSVLVL